MRWNEAKYKVLKYMEYRRENEQYKSLTARQLAFMTGTNPESLLGLLPKWTRWRYISRVTYKTRQEQYHVYTKAVVLIDFGYHLIMAKGLKWINWFEAWHPRLAKQYFTELLQHFDELSSKRQPAK